MIVQNTTQQQFCGRIIWSKAIKEVQDYAVQTGQMKTYTKIRKTIGILPPRNIQIVHKYSKSLNLVKSEFKFEKFNNKDMYVKTTSATDNPAEFTFQLLKDLLNKRSEIYKRIFE